MRPPLLALLLLATSGAPPITAPSRAAAALPSRAAAALPSPTAPKTPWAKEAPSVEPETPSLPPPAVTLRVDAPDPKGPWRLVVTNAGQSPMRVAADGRLLTLEADEPALDLATMAVDLAAPAAGRRAPAFGRATSGKRARPAPRVVCRLPPGMRPEGIEDERAIILPAGARYEEVVSPALYCFDEEAARLLSSGTALIARLGFPAAPSERSKGPRRRPPDKPSQPFVVEPAEVGPRFAPLKELVSERFVVPPSPGPAEAPWKDDEGLSGDPNAPSLELVTPDRVDAENELTIPMAVTLKNGGARPVLVHLRRDDLTFEVDGPSGSARCGAPVDGRRVPANLWAPLAPGASRTIDVWVGELCPDVVFDRPGLYRLHPRATFPPRRAPAGREAWSRPVRARSAVLVRIQKGKLPFYASRPEVLAPDGP